MSRNPLINTADAAGDGFATTENGILRVPGESPTTYQWQRYVERLELEVENKSLGHVLREANGRMLYLANGSTGTLADVDALEIRSRGRTFV